MSRKRTVRPLATLFDRSLAAQHTDGVVPLGAFNTEAFPDDGNISTECHQTPTGWVHVDQVPDGETDVDGLNSHDPLAICMRKQE